MDETNVQLLTITLKDKPLNKLGVWDITFSINKKTIAQSSVTVIPEFEIDVDALILGNRNITGTPENLVNRISKKGGYYECI
jgi:hypothetical protein